MEIKSIKFFLLLCLFFSFVISNIRLCEENYEIIEPNENVITKKFDASLNQVKLNATSAYKLQKYKIEFTSQSEIPKYIRIRLDSSEKEIKKIISFYPDESNDRKNRLQISQSRVERSSDTVDMWIKKDQIQDNYLYTTVECSIKDDEKCGYTIEFEGYNYIFLNETSFNYNYYVSENNKKIELSIYNNIKDIPEEIFKDKQVFLTLYASGARNIKITLNNDNNEDNKKYDFKIGTAIITNITNKEFLQLTVEANEGDYISVGSKATLSNGGSFQNLLLPNDYHYQYIGYLNKDTLNRECYYISYNTDYGSVSYITAIFYDKIGQIIFKDSNFEDILSTKQIIQTGYFSYVHNPEIDDFANRKYICIEMPDSKEFEIEDLTYSLQLIQPSEKTGISNYYGPQLPGLIYPRIISKGSTVFFNAADLKHYKKQIIYNMITTEGLPNMYISKCLNYPLCDLNITNTNNFTAIDDINRLSTWHNDNLENYNSPIDHEQYIMVVNCVNLDGLKTDRCQFQTLIYEYNDNIELIEGQPFSQYILDNQIIKYTIEFAKEKTITKVHIDNFIVNGDVNINITKEDSGEILYHKYYLANKIFYSINLNEEQNKDLKKIIVTIEARVNSYYTIEYRLARGSDEESTNNIFTGINYLVPIKGQENSWKKVNIHTSNLLEEDLFFASFYSLNCRFNIQRIDEDKNEIPISSYVNYAQDVIDPHYENYTYVVSYNISVVETDVSKYENNMCMLYVSGLDLTKEKDSIAQKEILLSEGVPQKTIFQYRLVKTKYIYPVPNKDRNVAIFFKVINPANYTYNITYNHKEVESHEFYQSHIRYLDQTVITDGCKELELCNVIISIDVFKEDDDLNPIIEVTAKQINNTAYYIPKGVVKQDFVSSNSWLYVYTTLGKDDDGYITLDFSRGSGLIFAKVVEFDEAGDENPEWRQFSFPKNKEESLYYEFYNKRIVFTNKNTTKCKNGCYLLIALQSSVQGNLNEQFRFHQFTITVSISPIEGNLKDNGQIIQIEPEVYVIGALSNEKKIRNKDMYQFYQIVIPYNADEIEFDWQSDSAILLINVGDERPNIENHHFIFKNRSDTVYELKRQDIFDHLKVDNYITNANLTIGVYTEDYESRYGTAYSFRVHFTKKLNIYKVNSDQKTLCETEKIDNNQFRCLFMITYSELDFIYDLIIYSKSQSTSASTYMYADFIDKFIYDTNNVTELVNRIPRAGNATFDTKKARLDYIFLTLSDSNSHLYVNVISDTSDTIEFITSFKTFDNEMSPNPSSVQLFSMNNINSMKLTFRTTKSIIINIVNLHGYSKIYLDDEKKVIYSLRGRDDRLSLALPDYNSEPILIIENMDNENDNYNYYEEEENENEDKIEKPALAFYVEYYARSVGRNFDEVYLGKTDEMAYKQTDFPLYYYSKINNLDDTINVFYVFHDLELIDEQMKYRTIESKDFKLKASIIPQKKVYLIKTNEKEEIVLKSIKEGKYDPSIQVGQIMLSPAQLHDLTDNPRDDPTLYLSLENNDINVKYKKIGLELSVIPENNDIPVTEKLYQYGKISVKDDLKFYRLKVDNSTGDMRIQFSTNSKNIDFAINTDKNTTKNMSLSNLECKAKRGKLFLTFNKPNDVEYIYLNVFIREDAKNIDPKLNNFVFKYMNSIDRKYFFEYPILDNNSTITILEKKDDILKVEFNRLDIDKEEIDITYSLKLVKESPISKEESVYTIAMIESDSFVTQIYKKGNNKDDKVQMQMENYIKDYSYIEVIAQIKDGPILEYVAYDPICKTYSTESESDSTTEKNSNTLLYVFIGIICGIIVIAIVLIIIMFVYKNKTKDLLEKVNKISFADNERKEKSDNLLLDDENKLK